MEKKKRMDWIDAARGIGILLIVGIHSIRPDMRETQAICKFIYDLIIVFVIGMFLYFQESLTESPMEGIFWNQGVSCIKKHENCWWPFFGYTRC